MTRPREEIEALLPFYVNGTLEPSERTDVEAALAEDDALRAEADALAAIRDTMRAEATDIRSPGEFGLARLMRDIDRDAPPAVSPQRPRVDRSAFWKIAAGVLLALGVAQAVLLMQAGDDGFRLAGGGAADEAVIAITFAPAATEQQIRDLLLEAGVEFVSGPSALGIYELARAPGIETDAALATLLDARGIVDTAQRIGDD